MTALEWFLVVFCLIATTLHVGTTTLAMRRCRQRKQQAPPPQDAPRVSILRPICGLDTYDELTLRSSFTLDYPNFELVFCCAQASDPAAVLVRRLIALSPCQGATSDRQSRDLRQSQAQQPRQRMARANGEWIIFADSNVLMPRDYVQRLLSGWRDDTGILCSPPIGCRPDSLGAELGAPS